MALLAVIADIVITYAMIKLWFFLFGDSILALVLAWVSGISGAIYALGQYPWAVRKIKEHEYNK